MNIEKIMHNDAREIFMAGLEVVDPEKLIHDRMKLDGSILKISADGSELSINLDDYSRLLLLGVGKASARMALAAEAVLGSRINGGLIVVKYGHTEDLKHVRLIESGHPVPDENSIQAADEMIKLCSDADENTLIINLISGGGSALLCKPYKDEDFTLSLADKQEVTKQLLACGAEIQEINCFRKHLSGVKGGRLAALMYPARSVNLILSDVVGDDLSSIASGMTAPDNTAYDDVFDLIKKYDLEDDLPKSVIRFLLSGQAGNTPDTPKAGDEVFSKTDNVLVGSNYLALKAAHNKAEELGYNTTILSSRITGEAREAAKFYFGIASDLTAHDNISGLPACIIAGGETTVILHGTGLGGRNQEMALAFMTELKQKPDLWSRIAFLSGATDGNDGPTDAAGGLVCSDILHNAEQVDLLSFLKDNDSYHALELTNSLLKTGPTNTNVCDIQVILVI